MLISVDLVGPFTIRRPAKTQSLLAIAMIDPEIQHSLVRKFRSHNLIGNTYPGFVS
jgi:hypothetical protein